MRRVVAARQISSAALRISDQGVISGPKLFIDEQARQSLERKLRLAFGNKPVVLSITDNRKSIISHETQSGVMFARIHHMFLSAGPTITDALVQYILHDDRDSGLALDQYISENGQQLARRKKVPLKTQGHVYDLSAIYDKLNEQYFGGQVRALITWGRARKAKKPRKTIRLGSYTQSERLIQINPVLDHAWVPRYFVEFIVYHEMLHHEHPVDDADERRCLHPPEFLEQEQKFRGYARAIAWEQKNLRRLLR